MSTHGWSSEGHGDGTGEGAGGWAPPLETETPDPAEIREEEEEARTEDIAHGDAQERVPARDGQDGDVERCVKLTKGLVATRRRRTKVSKKTCSASRHRR
ncbi:hypothetical protein PI124_g17151 [Phytophthora idaei]|nr:hypothetical protein PI125_g18456 [Phytophthora idaei]KAG3137859.1 hypothetical protein PI126_g17188 [Phytophthora idaei]KAG3237886.1 hypothetical protein PI124_g17151 [Phytophthora idaei]